MLVKYCQLKSLYATHFEIFAKQDKFMHPNDTFKEDLVEWWNKYDHMLDMMEYRTDPMGCPMVYTQENMNSWIHSYKFDE